MNREKAKRGFIIKILVAVITIYVLVVGCIAYYGSIEKKDAGEMQRITALDNLQEELNACGSEVSSAGVEEGMNLAKASTVLRRYDSTLGFWDPVDRTDTLVLYRSQKDEKGNVTGLRMVNNTSTFLIGVSRGDGNKKYIILEDWFSPDQIQHLKDLSLESVQMRGYEKGGILKPLSLHVKSQYYEWDTANDVIEESTITPAKKATGREVSVVEMVDVSVDSADTKAWQEEDKSWETLVAWAVDLRYNKDEVHPGLGVDLEGTDDSILTSETVGVRKLEIGDYWLGFSVIDHPLAKAISGTRWVCFIIAITCTMIGLLLIGSYSRIIDLQYEAEAKRRKMTDALAHEMKTPLGIIKNYSEVLLEEQGQEKRKKYLDTIIEETDDMNQMIVSMLDLSKMEAGTYPLELSMLSVTAAAEKVIERTRILMKKKGLEVELKSEEKRQILADEKLVTQSISNLLLNAISHGSENSCIRICIKEHKGSLRFLVHNQGEAVAEQDLGRIWESFYRSEAARDRQSGGTGLGLAIVRNACILHRGTCGCENKNKGVEFWFEIPDQEELPRTQKNKIGPILNLEDRGLDLRGLAYSLAGSVIWLLPNAYLFLVQRHNLYFENPMLPWVISLPGWVLCWIGAQKLKKCTKYIKLLNAAIPAMWLGVILYLFFSDKEQFQDIRVVYGCVFLMAAGLAVYLAVLSLACRQTAVKFGDRVFAKCIQVSAAVELIVLAACYLIRKGTLFVQWDYSWGNMLTGLMFLLILINMYFWNDTYRRYHGREVQPGGLV